MALSFISHPADLCLSSSIGAVAFDTDHDFILVEIAVNNKKIFSQNLFPAMGKVYVDDVGVMVEAEMRVQDLAFSSVSIHAFSEDYSIAWCCSVIFCDRIIETEDLDLFLRSNFLTTSHRRRVPPEATVNIPVFLEAGEDLLYGLKIRFFSGSEIRGVSLQESAATDPASPGISQINISIPELRQEVRTLMKDPDIRIADIIVSCGERSFHIFVDNTGLDYTLFLFRNCFNSLERIFIPGATEFEYKVDSQSGFFGGVLTAYDLSQTPSFKTVTDYLSFFEFELLAQMLASHDIFSVRESPSGTSPRLFRIIASKPEIAFSTANDSLNAFSFSWQYDSSRPVIALSDLKEIFSSQFNEYFA